MERIALAGCSAGSRRSGNPDPLGNGAQTRRLALPAIAGWLRPEAPTHLRLAGT